MCGITGIFGLENTQEAQDKINWMNNTLAHRGPDAKGTFVQPNIALGHQRLAIIDLSAAGNQPFYSPDKRFCMVYNGEVYNYLDVKKELPEFNFQTQSDTEVILAAYQKWGKSCLEKLNGMFALAIWDKQEETLFIARDRMGIKPVYYYKSDENFVFASEIRALLKSDLIPKKLNPSGLTDYLRYQTVHAPETILQDVFMLLPGHCLTISKNKFEIVQYWNILKSYKNTSDKQAYPDVKNQIQETLLQAVEKRLVADVPYSAFLSGGIDSSIIVGLMSQVAKQKVKTFSVTFAEPEFSEARFAKIIADKFQTDHTEIQLSPDDFLELIPNALQSMDHPSGDGPNTYVVSKVTKAAGITVALSGLGGDELFAGYDIFKRSLKLENYAWMGKIPKTFRKLGGEGIKMLKSSVATDKIAEILKQEKLDFENTYPLSRQVLMDEILLKVLNKNSSLQGKEGLEISNVKKIVNSLKDEKIPLLSKVSYAEVNSYMQNTLLRDTDQMSMAHALEVRVPFLDHELYEYVFGIRDSFKYPHSPKKLLVDSVGDLLPDKVVNRPKMGFVLPWENWLKKELKSFAETKIASLAKRSYFHENEINQLWKRFLNQDQKITWARIWILVVLENWLQENGVS